MPARPPLHLRALRPGRWRGHDPPDLAVPATTTPASGKALTPFTIHLQVTEPLRAPPTVRLQLDPPATAECVASPTDPLRYECSYTATGEENSGRGGVIAFDVTLQDQARLESLKRFAGSLTLDFAPPELVTASVAYLPALTNPLAQSQTRVTSAREDTVVRVTVIADSLLGTDAPTLTATNGQAALDFQLVSRTDTSATFEATPGKGLADGIYVPTVAWSDAVGNWKRDATFPDPVIRVKTSPPKLEVVQEHVTYLRSPLGNGSPEVFEGISWPAGPLFALAPADTLSGATTFPGKAFSLASGEIQEIRLWGDSLAKSPLGVAFPLRDLDGTLTAWPKVPLLAIDHLRIWATGVDEAGNETRAAPIERSEWVATPNAPPFGASPHLLQTSPYVGPTFTLDPDTALPSGAGAGTDGATAVSQAEPVWHQVAGSDASPGRLSEHALAYDSARGRVVLFGLLGSAFSTWEWDGRTWSKAECPVIPSSLHGSLVYDSARGRVVLFVGNGEGNKRLWEWDGTSWTAPGSSSTQAPSIRCSAMLANDSARGRLVLFGGEQCNNNPIAQGDTWEWDGSAWTNVTPTTGASPPARGKGSMVYDSRRHRVVLFGGGTFGDTWEWDGKAWVDRTPATGGPPLRTNAMMSYDETRGRVVLFGGLQGTSTKLADLWEWDGSTWVDRTPSTGSPSGRYSGAMVFDGARGTSVLYGGATASGRTSDTWGWNGTRWSDVTPDSGAAPRARTTPLAYDSDRGRMVLFGGRWKQPCRPEDNCAPLQDTWEFDGLGWHERSSPTAPSPRESHVLVYDAARRRTVVFGGWSGQAALGDVWEWDGSTWVDKTPASGPAPAPRFEAAAVYDAARKRVLVFGGTNRTTVLPDLWEWDGTSWTQRTPATLPPARRGAAMAYDPVRERVVLFAGITLTTKLEDVWEWDGTSWEDRSPPNGATPGARVGAVGAYDALSGRTVFVGGLDYFDVWEWDGTKWYESKRNRHRPARREGGGVAYDEARNHLMLFGGEDLLFEGLWERSAAPSRQPGVQFTVDAVAASIAPSTIDGLRVRAFCGGRFDPFDAQATGATLHGWSTGGPVGATDGRGPGQWVELKSNAAGIDGPFPVLDWEATSRDQAAAYVLGRTGALAFQCRPAGITGRGENEAEVSLDYAEVRVRYTIK